MDGVRVSGSGQCERRRNWEEEGEDREEEGSDREEEEEDRDTYMTGRLGG